MSKKNRKKDVVLEPENNEPVVFEEDKPLYESEAYGSLQPEAGSDVTVVKQIGLGGPVPIVAPKHSTIQLQPIVVPLAVVPYMSQDSGVLRTEGKQAYAGEDYVEATDFSEAQNARNAKREKRLHPRLFVLATLLISAVLVLPFILSYFMNCLGALDFGGEDRFNIIGTITSWIQNRAVDRDNLLRDILFIATGVSVAIMLVVELIAFLAGKYPRAFSIIFALISSGTSLAVLIIDMVAGNFVASERVAIIVFLALALFNLLLAIIFTVVFNRADDKEDRQKYSSEI